MIDIVSGTTRKPVASQQLAEFFKRRAASYSGILYFGYPIIAAPDGAFAFDAVWVSRERGIVIFCLVEETEVAEDYGSAQDRSANLLDARLRNHTELMRGREFLASPEVITFAPAACVAGNEKAGYPLCNLDNLDSAIERTSWNHPEKFENVVSVLQSISQIRKGKRTRTAVNPESRGSKLRRLEESVANLDYQQGRAVIETVDGVQRIRGIAGSGKTMVLALKAAYLHVCNPDWRIAVTFNSRSLKEQFLQLIKMFVVEQTGDEPDWSALSVINACGSPGGPDRTGLYYEFVRSHGLEYADFQEANRQYGHDRAFASACRDAVAGAKGETHLYDAILVDEAQELGPDFLQMCFSMLEEPKRLVYAYDEMQSWTCTSLPPPEKLFGTGANGRARVRFLRPQPGLPQQDIVLEKCYRNSRPVLVTAHALGFGIYRKPDVETGTGLVQVFQQPGFWNEIGYREVSGELAEGHTVRLARPPETSPAFLEDHSSIDDLIQFRVFNTKIEQAEWLVDNIEQNIGKDELTPDDIMVINPNPTKTRQEVGIARRLAFERGVNSHFVGVGFSVDHFFDEHDKSIAFSGIHRAKGNEAAMVYIINAQDCAGSYGQLLQVRNQLFTAITRSKAWVRVLGIGKGMEALVEEFEKVRENNFELEFVYPGKQVLDKMRRLHLDITEDGDRVVKASVDHLSKFVDDFEAGRVRLQDLPKETIAKARTLLGDGVRHG